MMDRGALNELGPYLNGDGDWWVPATISYKQARHLAESCLSYDIPFEGTLVYKGKQKTLLCFEMHDDPAECDHACSHWTLAYHWMENLK